MSIIALKLNRLSVPNTLILGRKIVAAMTNHASRFEEPPVPLVALTADLNDLDKLQQERLGGGSKANTVLRNQKLEDVRASLRLLAAYVQTVSRGNEAIINEAGMDVKSRGPRKIETILPPEGIQIDPGEFDDGLKLRWKAVKNAKQYGIEYCAGTVTSDKWRIIAFSNGGSIQLRSLESGQLASFRIFSLGAAGKSEYSMVVNERMK